MALDQIKLLYESHFGHPPERVEPLEQDLGASPRQLIRLGNGTQTAIGVFYEVREENAAFIEFTKHFRHHGLPVPEIFAADLDQNVYLEEDLGDTTLYEFLTEHRQGDNVDSEVVDAYRRVVALLPRFQIEAGHDLDYSVCYPRDSFDRQSITWDLNYFKYCFLRLTQVPFNEQGLEEDFRHLTDFLLGASQNHFLYRDFQSRNIMLRDGDPFFLDYQGGRKGALQYDIASLLYDARADLPPALREELLESYLEALSNFVELDRTGFMQHYYAYVYVRIMQAMGAYGYRGLYERKPHFIESIPYALKNVGWLLENAALPIKLPILMATFGNVLAKEELHRLGQ